MKLLEIITYEKHPVKLFMGNSCISPAKTQYKRHPSLYRRVPPMLFLFNFPAYEICFSTAKCTLDKTHPFGL